MQITMTVCMCFVNFVLLLLWLANRSERKWAMEGWRRAAAWCDEYRRRITELEQQRKES